jgi:SAM-dependent methyltransferase
MSALYDRIGLNYAELRKPDPRIAKAIEAALGSAQTILNVGAGTGSYEPQDRALTAVEPSREMIAKRPPGSANVIQASAEQLPFATDSFDASMAVLTVHHWTDKAAGLREMRRVTRGPVVIVTFDPAHRPWLTEYLPQLAALDSVQMPEMADYERWLGTVDTSPLLVPHDCTDGFLYAYWRRPSAYLDPRIRTGSSSFFAIGNVDAELARLAQDIESGAWAQRYHDLLALDAYDAGYRIVVAQ